MSLSSSGAQLPVPRPVSQAGSWRWTGATEPPLCSWLAAASNFTLSWLRHLSGDWGYRRMTTYGGRVGPRSIRASRGPLPRWVSSEVEINGRLGSADTTAQVHPAAFTNAMMRAAQERGAELRIGRVTGLLRRGGDVVGVDLDGETLEGTQLSSRWGHGQCLRRDGSHFLPCSA